MADIFQQELDSPEGPNTSNENTTTDADSGDKPKESNNENNDQVTNVSNELDVELELDNFYYIQSQPAPTLVELAKSDYIHNRQLAAKKILESLQRAGSNQEELQCVISVMCELSEDEETIVRSELVHHIPSIALFCHGHPSGLKLVIQQQLVPYTVKLLNDPQITVRKLAQSALLVLLENNLIGQLQLSEWICPLISQLAMCESNSEEQRIEDVTVMSMMIPLVDKSMAIKFFLEPYVSLCCDPAFGIRTVCAMRFGTLCKIAGTETTELYLLPSFLNLCCDDLWGVRKACADVFVDVASVVSLKTRKEVLPHIFINLLNDASRYVEHAAYQSLGGLISTYADPSKTGCSYKDGKLHIDESFYKTSPKPRKKKKPHSDANNQVRHWYRKRFGHEPKPVPVSMAAKEGHASLHVDNTFNAFQYWRAPLPEVGLDVDMDEGSRGTTAIHVTSKEPGEVTSEITLKIDADGKVDSEEGSDSGKDHTTSTNTFPVESCVKPNYKLFEFHNDWSRESRLDSRLFNNNTLVQNQESANHISATSESSSSESESEESESEVSYDQDIIPTQLLFKYTSIIDNDFTDKIIEYCAYSFPAVAFTLGRKYWPCIRSTCKKLAGDIKWTVRLPIASSLHDLAAILGHDLTVRDLLPIFQEYLGEVDDVRTRLVAHLPQFLEHLTPARRRGFLTYLPEFTRLYNEKNWRFRCALAEKLQPTANLYSTYEVYENFLPISLQLLQDRISAVRIAAAELMAVIIKILYKDEETERYCKTLLTELDVTYRKAKKWSCRQTYVLLCDQVAKKISLPVDVYVEEMLPNLFSLVKDDVPNVRLAVARCFAHTLSTSDYLQNLKGVCYMQLLDIVECLLDDMDTDVRHFAFLFAKYTEKILNTDSLLQRKKDNSEIYLLT